LEEATRLGGFGTVVHDDAEVIIMVDVVDDHGEDEGGCDVVMW
jgi:hypothetical protein